MLGYLAANRRPLARSPVHLRSGIGNDCDGCAWNALIVPDGNRLYPVEADVNDIADRLRAAPRIFVVRNAGRSIDRDIIATFDGWDQETHRFGRVSVETFERVS